MNKAKLMSKAQLLKIAKWGSLGLIAFGFVVAIIGYACGGLNTINFMFWK